MTAHSKKQIWYDYCFLTDELLKFSSAKYFDTFVQILEQRAALIDLLKSAEDPDDFWQTDERQEMLNKVLAVERTVQNNVKQVMRFIENKNNLATTYDTYGQFGNMGMKMDARR